MSTVDPFDSRAFRALGHSIVDLLADHLDATAQRRGRVLPAASPHELLAHTEPIDGRGGADALALARQILAGSNRLHDPRFVGHQVAAPLPHLALFAAVNALCNNSTAVFEMGPQQTAMELRVVAWLCARLGWPAGADGVLTSGGSLGNLTALLAARQRMAPGAWQDGGADFCVLASDQAHYCVDRAVRMLGWGERGLVTVPVDDRMRMRADLLPERIATARAAGRRPIAVVASACTTSTGSFDPIDRIADVCRDHGLWLHVDGAHGASYVLCPELRDRLRGIERADSVVWDAHKMLQVPALATGVLFRDGAACAATFAQQAAYLFANRAHEEWWNRGHRTVECTRPAMGALLYAALQTTGTEALAATLRQGVALATAFAERIAASNDFELAVPPDCNIVCFRHRPGDGRDLDAHNRALRARSLAAGSFYVVQTTLPAGVFLRTTLVNPRTTLADLDDLLAHLRALAGELRAEQHPGARAQPS